MKPVIEIAGLTRRFGRMTALDAVTLDIPEGSVVGLVGANGAGKTTLLKHCLGLYRPQAGTVRVLGRSPVDDPVGVLSQIGYVSEDRPLAEWMTVTETIQYTAAFYPDWDQDYAQELLRTFALDAAARVGTLSRGQRARLGLLAALAYRPAILLLDEPSSGLDPLVRRDILGAIIRTVADEGRTVVFSSHLLDEVQRVCDRFAMLSAGRLTISGSLDELLAAHQRITFRFETAPTTAPTVEGLFHVQGTGLEWSGIANGERATVERRLEELGARVVEREVPTLEDVFVAHCD